MHRIPVFYDPAQTVTDRLPSPSAAKPRHVVESWLAHRLPIEAMDFEPVTEADLCSVHEPAYVRGVLSLALPNGFGTRSEAVAESLRWTSGSFAAAALHAFQSGGVACSPTSGFHHAEYASGGGFCTFNGLMVAAHRLVRAGAKVVAVLDCDAHYGNGTDDILERVPLLQDRVWHYTRNAPSYRNEAEAHLEALEGVLTRWWADGASIVLYQAGADPHVNDPLGGLLTTKQLRERDRIVFSTCRRLGLPIAWNLAGGYQERVEAPFPERIRPVLDLHDTTMRECARAFVGEAVPGGAH